MDNNNNDNEMKNLIVNPDFLFRLFSEYIQEKKVNYSGERLPKIDNKLFLFFNSHLDTFIEQKYSHSSDINDTIPISHIKRDYKKWLEEKKYAYQRVTDDLLYATFQKYFIKMDHTIHLIRGYHIILNIKYNGSQIVYKKNNYKNIQEFNNNEKLIIVNDNVTIELLLHRLNMREIKLNIKEHIKNQHKINEYIMRCIIGIKQNKNCGNNMNINLHIAKCKYFANVIEKQMAIKSN